jgi:hypothetical protein
MSHDLIKMGTEIVTGASILHTILPPWEAFNDYPGIQKPYKVIVFIIGYAALNGRSTVYPGLSTKSGSQVSDAVVKTDVAIANGTIPPQEPKP